MQMMKKEFSQEKMTIFFKIFKRLVELELIDRERWISRHFIYTKISFHEFC